MPIPFIGDVFTLAKQNPDFRHELTTATQAQVTLMSIPPGGDQALIFVAGSGKAIVEGVETPINVGSMALIPLGTRHNFINTGADEMKIVSLYAPPHHAVGTVHHTKADADAAEAAQG